MPCLPGFLPVINDDHAEAVIGGKVVSRSARAPPAIKRARFGRYPFSISESRTLKEAPSSPMTNSFLLIIVRSNQAKTILGSQRFIQLLASDCLCSPAHAHPYGMAIAHTQSLCLETEHLFWQRRAKPLAIQLSRPRPPVCVMFP